MLATCSSSRSAILRCTAAISKRTCTTEIQPVSFEVSPLPKEQLSYDTPTHTSQAWDQQDYRRSRFLEAPKQVNPNFAINLIATEAPMACKERVVSCDGGDGALGHPKIYINLDMPGNHACGYCGLRFFKEGQEHDGSEHIQV